MAVLSLVGCGTPAEQAADVAEQELREQLSSQLVGKWQATLTRRADSRGASENHHHSHPLPFVIILDRDADGGLLGRALTDEEAIPFSRVEAARTQGGEVTVVMANDGYDSELTATLNSAGDTLSGGWRKTAAEGDSRMNFVARKGESGAVGRFSGQTQEQLMAQDAVRDFGGSWTATFTDEDGTSPARGLFEQHGRYLVGTFRTSTGDYRWLEGEVLSVDGDDELRLSTFDGAHAFLFHAKFETETGAPQPTLSGDFWSRDQYHATWTARPLQDGDELPNPFEEVGLTNTEGQFSFAFPDVNGTTLTSADPRFEGKVTLVEIFGSWCPNCNDSAPLLASLYEQYHDQGLEMVGLAYEMRGDFDRDAEMVRRYASRHGVTYPLLVAGTSDKEEAAQTLPDLEAVLSFPTKVFIDRRGKVREIYSGFDGPRTGEAHAEMKTALVDLIETLLAESGE